MPVIFYDGPDGRLFMRAPTGSGEFVGAATERDIMLNPDAYTAYRGAKANAERVEEPVVPEAVPAPVSEPPPVPETVAEHDTTAQPEPVAAPAEPVEAPKA